MTGPFRVLVTGSRDWTDRQAVHDALNTVVRPGLLVAHGGCPTGADAFASQWCSGWALAIGRTCERPYLADWGTHGKAAGPLRNARMVAAGADLCLAFAMPCVKPACSIRNPHPSHGTADCADKAQAAGIEVRGFGLFADRWQQQALEAL